MLIISLSPLEPREASSLKRRRWRMKRGEDGAAVKIPRRSKPARDFGNRKRTLLLSRATRLIRLPTAATFPKREGKSQKRPLR